MGCSGLTNVIVKTAVRLHHNSIGLASESSLAGDSGDWCRIR